MAYERRDLIGHWVRKTQPTQRMCQHACCRGKRVHPANMPVILPSKLLRRASDEDLAEHYRRVSHGDSAEDERAMHQVLAEMERRDAEGERKRHALYARKERDRTRRLERAEEYTRIAEDAERATNGYLVNPEGRRRGISDAEILSGREVTFHRYASDEARNYFADNPRPTGAYFRGKDTRVGPRYTAPKRRRHPYAFSRSKAA